MHFVPVYSDSERSSQKGLSGFVKYTKVIAAD